MNPANHAYLEIRRQEQTIAHRYDDDKGDDTARDPSCQEMGHAQVALSRVAIFHHNRRYPTRSATFPTERARRHLLMLGNPLVGRPAAAEHINTLAITSRFGCGSFMPAPT